ncbi:MAG: hypothetical protein RL696_419, partial [Actinomycetota bacterium]
HITKVAILNADDPIVSEFEPSPGVNKVTFGFDNGADFEIGRVTLSLAGTDIEMMFPDGDAQLLRLKILGEHQAMNAAAALAAAEQLGIQRAISMQALSDMELGTK